MAALGVTWTVDSNPKRKAILEKTFRMLGENHLKECFGYIGGGIKSRKKNTVTQQELKDIYSKPENMLGYDQLCAIVCTAIHTYNTSVRKSLGVSPEERYSKSEQPHSIKADEFTYLPLFHHQTAHKIANGQITIRRGLHKYEYQLPAKYSAEYNGKQVGVVYANLDEIYLFDLKTERGICSVEQKIAIHGALANQTQADHDNLMRNTGRIKGNQRTN